MSNNDQQPNRSLDLMVANANTALAVQAPIQSSAYHHEDLKIPATTANDYWIAWKRGLKYALLLIPLLAILALGSSLLINKTYTSKASIKIETDHTRILEFDVDTSRPPSYINDDVFYNTQYKLLRNRDLARQVIDDLVIEDYLLKEKRFIKPVYEAKDWVKQQIEWLRSFLPNQTGNGKAEKITAEEIFFQRLTINPVRRSRIIDLHYTSQDPDMAQDILNAYIKHFIRFQQQQRLQSSEQAKEYLSEQIEDSRDKMQEAEEKLLDYARKNKIVDTKTDTSVIANNISLLNEAYIKAKSRRIDAESQYQNKKNISTLLNSDADPVIQAKKQELSSLQAEYRSKLSLFKPAYPEMQKLKQQIDQLERFISTESRNVQANTSKNMEANYVASLEEEKKLQREIRRLENDLLKFHKDSIGYTSLKRDVDTSRNLYEGLLQRLKEINVIGPVPDDNISVVDSALLPPRKDGLSLSKLGLLGAFLGLALYSLISFLREFLFPKIRSEKSLNQLASAYPVLASIPKIKKGFISSRLLSINEAFGNQAAESLRYLRTSLQLNNGGKIPQTIHITSPNSGDGKSTIAVFLATSLANTGKKVLLIDADLRRPNIHKKLRLDNSTGLSNYLYDGQVKPHKCFLKQTPLYFMAVTAGPAVVDPVDTLESPKIAGLIAKSKRIFDHIIIDSPPVLGLADAVVISQMADSSLLIVSNNNTSKSDALQAMQRLEQGNGKLAGLVCNKTDRSFSKSYYNSRYADGRALIAIET